MDRLTLLEQARSAGLMVTTQGDRLVIRGPRRAGSLAEQLLAHKDGIIDTPALETLTPTDLLAAWHLLWDERAAIVEYEDGLPRKQAEALALADILRAMERAGIFPRDYT